MLDLVFVFRILFGITAVEGSLAHHPNGSLFVRQIGSVTFEEGGAYDKYYEGHGYCTKRGVINLQLKDNPPPPKMTEEQLDAHLIGVALLTQYNLKKG